MTMATEEEFNPFDFEEDDEVSNYDGEFEIAMNFLDDDMTAKLEEMDAHCSLIAEGKYIRAVSDIKKSKGESGIMELVFAIERHLGWHMEIVCTKAEIEDAMFNRHGIFDARAWEKAKNTEAWSDMTMAVTYAALRARFDIVDEACSAPVERWKKKLRQKLFNMYKSVDLSLQ